jgi:APA family basic amino acid/polyamine antiporter
VSPMKDRLGDESGAVGAGDRSPGSPSANLERAITLPMLVFYGVGVTVGAGIFALIGEILDISGDQAPLALLVAGCVAGVTGISYMALVREFPSAGGEAVYTTRAFGSTAGRIAGLGVVVTGTVSSAVVALAFGGYVSELVSIPERVSAIALVLVLALVAVWGVRQSVALAAAITVLELSTLIAIVAFGLPELTAADDLMASFSPGGHLDAIVAGSVLAFFAFIGFEDIANMAEETVEPRVAAPRAIAWTLSITLVVYLLLATLAANLPERGRITESDAPLAEVFEIVSGLDSAPVATIASLAMLNGILVQLVMASRVLYGMATEGQLPARLGRVNPERHTPTTATALIAACVVVLVIAFPLVRLAQLTSLVTLSVFTLVNLSLFVLASRGEHAQLRKWRWFGAGGAVLTVGLAIAQLVP